jgi:hypothetical protein
MASRLSSRLQNLERSSGADGISPDAARLLVQLLARLDGLFWPFRTNEGSYRAEVRRLQLEYLSGAGGIVARSQGENNWKAGHHSRNELITAKLVSPLLEGGQVVGLRLTQQGIADARAMVGNRLCGSDNKVVRIILLALRKFEGCEHSGKWMMENMLFGETTCSGPDPSKWDHATELLLPLLRCGAVECTSDSWHRASYRAVEGIEIPEEPPSTRQVEPWADHAYIQAFDSERAALMRSECDDGGIFIPMRCT